MKKLVLAILIYQILLFAYNPRPSFNCRKATTRIEHKICGSNILIQLDREMARKYFKLKKHLNRKDSKKLLRKQRSWINERNQECGNSQELTQCLIESYNKRISFFDLKVDGIGKKMCKQGKENCLTLGGTESECSNWCR